MKRIYRIAIAFVLAVSAATPAYRVVADDVVETVAAESRAAGVQGGIQLSATGNVNFEIYSITGQRVKSVTVENSTAKVELPKGCYIVRCTDWSKKVIVK